MRDARESAKAGKRRKPAKPARIEGMPTLSSVMNCSLLESRSKISSYSVRVLVFAFCDNEDARRSQKEGVAFSGSEDALEEYLLVVAVAAILPCLLDKKGTRTVVDEIERVEGITVFGTIYEVPGYVRTYCTMNANAVPPHSYKNRQ
jgi:hypothetical protein